MKEYRCKFCHKLLFKYRIGHNGVILFDQAQSSKVKIEPKEFGMFEIVCPKCKTVNRVGIEKVSSLKA